MLTIRANTITLTRGDSARIELSITKDGEDYDFSADSIIFSVKTSVNDAEPVIQKQVINGVILLSPSDTKSLPFGVYYYDIEVTTHSGDVCTVIPPSKFIIAPEVT